MKKKLLYSILAILIVIHFLILHFVGISSYTTTLLFYFLLYHFLKFLTSFIKNAERKLMFLMNIRILLILFLLIEFSCTFLFPYRNEYIENKTGIYFSPYMHKAQIRFLSQLGFIDMRNAWEEGYIPFYRHFHETKDFKYDVSYNSLGLRGPLPPLKKDTHEFRIVVLGDSYAEGYGTNEDSTFPKLLEKELATLPIRVTVINGGICGSNPKSEIILYQHLLARYSPDLVILETNESDIQDFCVALNEGRMPVNEYFYAPSHIYRFWDNLNSDIDSNTIKRKMKVVENLIAVLNQFKTELSKMDQKFLVVSLPVQSQLYGAPGILCPLLSSSDLPIIDLKKYYPQTIPDNLDSMRMYYWKNDGHHTPSGYSLMAKTVAQQLIERNYAGIH